MIKIAGGFIFSSRILIFRFGELISSVKSSRNSFFILSKTFYMAINVVSVPFLVIFRVSLMTLG